jgi:hypothetical protein
MPVCVSSFELAQVYPVKHRHKKKTQGEYSKRRFSMLRAAEMRGQCAHDRGDEYRADRLTLHPPVSFLGRDGALETLVLNTNFPDSASSAPVHPES